MRVASDALNSKLADLRVKLAMQSSRTVRLHHPLLEARMQQLGLKVLRQEDSLAEREDRLGLLLAAATQDSGGEGAAGGGGAQQQPEEQEQHGGGALVEEQVGETRPGAMVA
jgi:hypothetical protein